MEDLLWSMTQESRVLQDLRKDIQGIWQDQAARELTSRYLDPHESEDQQMLAGLNQQKEDLDQAQANLMASEDYGRQAEEFADLVSEGLKFVGQELKSTYGNYDTFAQYNSIARAKFPTISQLISEANNVCNGTSST